MNHIIIDNNQNIDQFGLQKYVFADKTIYIDGLIYTYGKKAGQDTVSWLYDNMNNGIPFDELRGAYSCIIQEKDKVIAFTDNSNMHCLYYSDKTISNSFLRTIRSETDSGKKLHFDLEAICEYLSLGNVYFDKTFYQGIHILNSEEIATIEQDKISISKKPIGDIDAPSSLTSISEFFDNLAYSLSDKKICQALTGGYDSRMIYTCMSKRMMDHPVISANNQNNKDVIYAKTVATANHDNLEIINIDKPEYSENIIDELFEKKDGIVPFDIDSDIRLLNFKSIIANKYDYHLTGDGGVLHKDWEWTQDLPFYNKKKSDAKRFYKQRMYYISIDHLLGDLIKPYFYRQEKHFIHRLIKISKPINTQSYDSWYYRISGNRRTDYNCNPEKNLISYAPLEEIDIVRYSYALPRRKRFFYVSMRKTMTNENKKIARIKTNYGTNASSEWIYIFIDIFYQSIEYIRKAFRLIGRKVLKKNIMNTTVLDWSMEQDIRNSEIAKKAIEYAKLNEYINTSLSMDSLSYSMIQRLIHIYQLFCFTTEKTVSS